MKILSCILISFATLNLANAQSKYFEVEVTGKGKPLILIPGYSCSGEVWDGTVEHLKNNYQLHVITLAGYAGVPAVDDDNALEGYKKEIIKYVEEQKLEKPMIIGHSLGAFMSLWVHSERPELFGKTICVDGVPFISALNDSSVTAEQMRNNPQMNKELVVSAFQNAPMENYIDNMMPAMLMQVSDSARARQIAEWSYASDRKTLATTIVDLSLTDIREDLAKIDDPVLVIPSKFGTEENSLRIYRQQYAKLPNKIIKVADSKHFVMYDQPTWLKEQIEQFLSK